RRVPRGGLQRLGQHVRPAAPEPVRPAGLSHAQARFPRGAAHPRARARRRHGARAEAVADDVGRASVDSRGAAGHRRDAGPGFAGVAGSARRQGERLARTGDRTGTGLMRKEERAMRKYWYYGIAAVLACAATAHAQGYKPTRPVELVVHTGPGGGSDVL